MTKDHATTDRKYIDWDHLKAIQLPVIDELIKACKVQNLFNIMSLSCDQNEEVVAQFYATVFIEDVPMIMHWTLNGKCFSITMFTFARLLGFYTFDYTKIDLHNGSIVEDSKLAFMYDGAYGTVKFGKTSGLKPFYKFLNHLF